MTTYAPEGLHSYLPAVDLSSSVGYAVKLSTTVERGVELAANGTAFLGVVLYGAKAYNAAPAVEVRSSGRTATIATAGSVRAIANAAITMGSPVTVHTNGKFKAAAGGDTVVGHAETAASAADDSFTLRLNGRYTVA